MTGKESCENGERVKKFWVYILRCGKDNTLYTGQTSHLAERVLEHMHGKGARYTRGRLPVALIYAEEYSSRGDAMRRERQIKMMSRKQKEELICYHDQKS